MSVKIINGKIEKEESIWLHRYFSSKFLVNTISEEEMIIRFSRVDTFSDGLEGWNYKIENLKQAVNLMAQYNNRVIDSGGEIVENDCARSSIIKGYSDSEFDKNLVEENIKERRRHFVSCWFASTNETEESRFMWNNYSHIDGELGMKVSVKWVELKEALIHSNIDFKAGFVDYSEKLSDEYMFLKDSSYKHEREFRLVIEKEMERKVKFISLGINNRFLKRIIFSIENSYNINKEKTLLENLGFENTQDSLKKYNVSELIPEFKRQKKDNEQNNEITIRNSNK
ncbi:hypothetical protein KCTC32516_00415 [Polaribacter huanghezhanensis]|uniref:hypothetical protein n=1 Tax=Polaribacter huanghezhanensis TaxID=1354726 RepID=UPI0026493F9E|nr:hypothetical protein [Polaribacter huanghezhanensis]WKD85077.1 hypothetical protein KCTC32516_00415 [Polaribacter huanghezhanensis]